MRSDARYEFKTGRDGELRVRTTVTGGRPGVWRRPEFLMPDIVRCLNAEFTKFRNREFEEAAKERHGAR